MDLTLAPDERKFQREVYEFFEAEVPDWYASIFMLNQEDFDRSVEFGTQFSKKLAARGWFTPHWPKEYGGSNLTRIERMILAEAIGYFEDPRGVHYMGAGWVGSALLRFGTPDQLDRYLRPTSQADAIWCQGFSEPNSGSDLASLQTRAHVDGDDFVLNGQKIWTSYADKADYCVIGARTDPAAPKHRGISFFIMNMKAPGVTVMPIPSMFGPHFCEVFLDNVRIPKRDLLGELNRGWYLMAGALDIERGGGLGGYMMLARRMEQITNVASQARGSRGPAIEDPYIRLELGARWVEIDVLKVMARTVFWAREDDPAGAGALASGLKLYSSELHQRIAQTGMEVAQEYGLLSRGSPLAPLMARLSRDYVWCRETTVAGGTSEVQRNVIAQRVLGLPR